VTTAEVALAAALGSSFLTGLAALGVVWVQEWRRGKASDRSALCAAVMELLSRSLDVAMRAQAMGETMKVRSGVREVADVGLRQRKLIDPLELHDWMAQSLAPLNVALVEVWTRCDQEGVRLANDVVGKCMDLVGASTALQPARSARDRMVKWAVGERWTPEMRDEIQRALVELAHARKRFADFARSTLGRGPADLFAQVDSPAGPEHPDRGPNGRTDQEATGSAPSFTRREWAAFVDGVKAGEFDHFVRKVAP
jgi:hypothetical protein